MNVSQLLELATHELPLRHNLPAAWVSYQPPLKPVWVRARATNLVTVFTNLLDNALKYGSTHPQLTVHLLTKNRWVHIGFADNGIGIPLEYRTKIFDPFFRVPMGNVHDIKGYGLGLSYVRQILVEHGGSIWVEGNEPNGSLFWIRLPLR
jgi:two-component system phosphate regulon sensor histidine kinase PhoR